jgi:RecB family exonuclease
MKISYIQPKYEPQAKLKDKEETSKYISYSQFSSFQKCPLYWKLCHIDKLKDRSDTIHTVFGDAMHTTVQNWLKIVFLETVKKSNEYDFKVNLMENIKASYKTAVEKTGKQFSTKEELTEFYLDGLAILEYLRKKRTHWFSTKDDELFGIEVPISVNPDPTKPNIILVGYLDCVLRNKKTGKVKILDFKTSKKGWTKWDKADETKTSQLVLYKIYFSEQYGIPIDEIDIEYLVLKRKLDEDSMYAQKRCVGFEPASGKITQSKTKKMFQNFIDSCFTETGEYNVNGTFPALRGNYDFNCRYCEFCNREDICPSKNRK